MPSVPPAPFLCVPPVVLGVPSAALDFLFTCVDPLPFWLLDCILASFCWFGRLDLEPFRVISVVLLLRFDEMLATFGASGNRLSLPSASRIIKSNSKSNVFNRSFAAAANMVL